MCKTFKDTRAPGAIAREPGEKWADFDARQRAHRAENTPKVKRKRITRAKPRETSRLDNTGLSSDR